MLLLFWCCGWSPRERECVCPRSARKKPKDAKCPRRRCNLVLGLVRGPLLAPTLRLHLREKERARPATSTSVPLGARAKVNPLALRQASATASALCVVLGLGARVAHLRSGSVLCFLSSKFYPPPSTAAQMIILSTTFWNDLHPSTFPSPIYILRIESLEISTHRRDPIVKCARWHRK